MMKKHGQDAIYYAHAGAGEIREAHFESKTKKGLYQFRAIATEVAVLVKKIQRLAEWGAW
jgi:hypothetical protein